MNRKPERPPILTRLQVITISQVNVTAQPRAAEDYEYPAHLAHECQDVANYYHLPVSFLPKNGDRHTFQPHDPAA